MNDAYEFITKNPYSIFPRVDAPVYSIPKKNNLDYWNSLTIEQQERSLRQKEKELGLKEGSTLLCQPYFERLSDEEIK